MSQDQPQDPETMKQRNATDPTEDTEGHRAGKLG